MSTMSQSKNFQKTLVFKKFVKIINNQQKTLTKIGS